MLRLIPMPLVVGPCRRTRHAHGLAGFARAAPERLATVFQVVQKTCQCVVTRMRASDQFCRRACWEIGSDRCMAPTGLRLPATGFIHQSGSWRFCGISHNHLLSAINKADWGAKAGAALGNGLVAVSSIMFKTKGGCPGKHVDQRPCLLSTLRG